jgi:transposase
MSPQAAKTRDFDQLERRRRQAAKLLDRGLSQAEVARRVKVSRESVRRWANRIAANGAGEGLKKAGRAGRTARLGPPELEKLEQILLGWAGEIRVSQWSLDTGPDCQGSAKAVWHQVSRRARMVDSAQEDGLELPATGGSCPGTERSGDLRLAG